MNYNDFISIMEDVEYPSFVKAEDVIDYNGICCVKNYVAMPLEHVSSYYISGDQVPVDNVGGMRLGVLCLSSGRDIDLAEMTDYEFAAYIYEVQKDYYGQPYQFKRNYFVISVECYDEYVKEYMNTSPLWGGYIHSDGHVYDGCQKTKVNKVIAISDLDMPTNYHIESCFRAVLEPYAFERYLKLYHLLELMFDYHIVAKIRALNEDMRGIGKLLASYERAEPERLKAIVFDKVCDVDRLALMLDNVYLDDDYVDKAIEIFMSYGKESSPIKGDNKENGVMNMLKGRDCFTIDNLKNHNVITKKDKQDKEEYEKFIKELVVYWIYRIRCSVAHNRIGEYVMAISDEAFVKDVAEPMIKEVLIQCFVKQNP